MNDFESLRTVIALGCFSISIIIIICSVQIAFELSRIANALEAQKGPKK
jgi:hypothetical protein